MSKNDNVADFSDFKHPPEWCIQNSKDIEFINDVSATSLIRKIYGAYLPEDNESRSDGSKERSVMRYVSIRNVFERLDCIFADIQFPGNLLVCHSLDDSDDHVALAVGKGLAIVGILTQHR